MNPHVRPDSKFKSIEELRAVRRALPSYPTSLEPAPVHAPIREPETIPDFMGSCLTCHIGNLECDKLMPTCTSCSVVQQTVRQHDCTYFEKPVNHERPPDPLWLTRRGPLPRQVHEETLGPAADKAESDGERRRILNGQPVFERRCTMCAWRGMVCDGGAPCRPCRDLRSKHPNVPCLDSSKAVIIAPDGEEATNPLRRYLTPLAQIRAEDLMADEIQELAQQTVKVRSQLRDDLSEPKNRDQDVNITGPLPYEPFEGVIDEDPSPFFSETGETFRRRVPKGSRVLVERRFAFRAGTSQDPGNQATGVEDSECEEDTLFTGKSLGKRTNKQKALGRSPEGRSDA